MNIGTCYMTIVPGNTK